VRSAWNAEVIPRPASRVYYGWVIVLVAAAAMVGTLPGRSQGLGLITEPLLRDYQLTRVGYAQINLVATLVGALFCFGIGALLDRHGSRVVLSVLSLALGATVVGMTASQSVLTLAILITLTRGLGQSALSIVSMAMVGKWFHRRITQAMGIYAVVMSVGFMAAFPLVGAIVTGRGWRVAWTLVAAALMLGLAPLAWTLARDTPEAIGLAVDDDSASSEEMSAEGSVGHATLRDALQSPAFWVFAAASAMYGLIASGVGLFNESILAERGFAPSVYHTALAVTAMTALGGNFAAGAYAARRSLRVVLMGALIILAAGLVALPHITTVAQVMAQAVAMGIGGGFVMVVFFSFWSRAYGRAHLGRIQGAAQALTVLASAIGPLGLAYCVQWTGSYAFAFYLLAAIVVTLAATAAVVTLPAGATTSSPPLASRSS
jgi:MFS family permease